MRVRLFLAAALSASVIAGVFACSSSDNGTTPIPTFDGGTGATHDSSLPDTSPAADSSSADVATADAADAASDVTDAGAQPLNRCGEPDFADADYSAADAARVVRFGFLEAGPSYDPPCMRIKAGESVTWHGDFGTHPMGPFNGDPNNPIPEVNDGGGPDGSFTVAFPEAGAFGYQCQVHSSMIGAIQVKP